MMLPAVEAGYCSWAPPLSLCPPLGGLPPPSALSGLAHPLGVRPWAACGPGPERTLVVEVFAFQWGCSPDGNKALGELSE